MTGEDNTAAQAGRDVLTSIWTVMGSAPLTSVLVFDDRPTALQAMSDLLRPLPGLSQIRCVTKGSALINALAAHDVDLVLIGIHHGSTVGSAAISLLLALHPTADVIVIGSATELDVLAAAYVRGEAAAAMVVPGCWVDLAHLSSILKVAVEPRLAMTTPASAESWTANSIVISSGKWVRPVIDARRASAAGLIRSTAFSNDSCACAATWAPWSRRPLVTMLSASGTWTKMVPPLSSGNSTNPFIGETPESCLDRAGWIGCERHIEDDSRHR